MALYGSVWFIHKRSYSALSTPYSLLMGDGAALGGRIFVNCGWRKEHQKN
jgi:hypothetical protein